MILKLSNIGPIAEADLELGKLTVICGKNNQGKTYLTYSLYGLLKNWKEFARVTVPTKLISKLRQEGVLKIDLKDYEDQIEGLIKQIANNYTETISSIFSANKVEFKKSNIDISIDDIKYDYSDGFESARGRGNTTYFEAVKEIDNSEIIITSSKGPEYPSFYFARDIGILLGVYFLRNYFPEPFLISSERTGVQLFQRELDINKNVLLETLIKTQKKKKLNPYDFIQETVSRYSIPVKDNIDFVRDIDQITKNASYIFDSRPDISTYIERMLDIQFKLNRGQASISVKKGKQNKNLPYYLTSTSVRALSDLNYYIKHKASKGDLLIVDEPEINLHPENQIKIARFFALLINNGINVLITTHSDYIIKELNNLIMLNSTFQDKNDFLKRFGYTKDEKISPSDIRVYVAEKGNLNKVEIDEYGMLNSSFDTAIDLINSVAEELSSKLHTSTDAI